MTALLRSWRWELILVALILVAGVWSATLSPYFLDPVTLLRSAESFVVIAVMAFGLYPIIVQGEIDISLPSTLAVSSVVLAELSIAGTPLAIALPLVLLLCAVLGAVNGVLVAVAGLPSLAVTLGTLGAYRGLAYIVAGDAGVTGIPAEYTALGSTWIGIAPLAVLLVVVVAIAAALLLRRTAFGRYTFAVGNGASAARMGGVPVAATRIGAYVLGSVMAGLAGWVWLAQYESARGDNADGTILLVLTAVVLGGVAITGGSGRASGVLLALVLLCTLQTGMRLANVPGTTQTLAVGVLLVASIGIPVAIDLLRRRRAARSPRSAVPARAGRAEHSASPPSAVDGPRAATTRRTRGRGAP
jgi:rhamnose transport system permease protein